VCMIVYTKSYIDSDDDEVDDDNQHSDVIQTIKQNLNDQTALQSINCQTSCFLYRCDSPASPYLELKTSMACVEWDVKPYTLTHSVPHRLSKHVQLAAL